MLNQHKFIFFGSPLFARIVLEKLVKNNFLPLALVCNPDKPFGRKKIIMPPETKKFVLENNLENQIKIFQPEILDKDFILKLKNLKPDFAVVCAYSKILPNEILNVFSKGILGIHPSLLPKYRGASPIQSAILAGEEKSGITIYLLDDRMDHGPILTQKETEIKNLNFEKVLLKLADLAGDLILEIIPFYFDGKIIPQKQDDNQATYTKKFKLEDGYIDLKNIKKAEENGGKLAIEIYYKILALNPEPGVWTIKNNKRIKLLDSEIINNKLIIKKIKIEGEKEKNTPKDFFNNFEV
jgi:methionyl-tRNA formyltransferase